MENFETKLKEFDEKCEALKNQEFENFGILEQTYCNLINEGNALRKYVIEHPEICNKKTILVLTNQVRDTSLIDEKFKSLTNILQLTLTLLQKYSEYVQKLLTEEKYEEAINIYNQMYNFTRNPLYKKLIAEIFCTRMNNCDKALEIMDTVKNEAFNDPQLCRYYAQIYSLKSDTENTEFYNKRADELELVAEAKNLISNNEYDKTINVYNELFKLTGNYNYQIEIANIYAVCLSNIDKAFSIYKNLENELKDDAKYWWQISQLYEHKDKLYQQVLCIQKALKLELKEIESKEASVCQDLQ